MSCDVSASDVSHQLGQVPSGFIDLLKPKGTKQLDSESPGKDSPGWWIYNDLHRFSNENINNYLQPI